MKVAIVHDYLREYGGAERVVEVLMEMFPEADVFTAYFRPEKFQFGEQEERIKTSVIQKLPFLWRRPNWLERKGYWRLVRLINGYGFVLPVVFRSFDLSSYDLVISSSAYCGHRIKRFDGQHHICYCHTPSRMLWDSPPLPRLTIKQRVWARFFDELRRWDERYGRQVETFIANSLNVQKRIMRSYGKTSHVVYPPVDLRERVPDFVPSDRPDEGYYLVVSRLDELKHVDIIIRTFNRLRLPLVIVGTGVRDGELMAIAGPTVSFTGFATDEDLCNYYDRCKALVIAAEDEDFGITAVEGQLFGKAVIAPAQGGFLETVIDGQTGVLFDPLDETSLEAAIKRYERMRFDPEKIKANAARFSRKRFIEGMKAVIDKVVLDPEQG